MDWVVGKRDQKMVRSTTLRSLAWETRQVLMPLIEARNIKT